MFGAFILFVKKRATLIKLAPMVLFAYSLSRTSLLPLLLLFPVSRLTSRFFLSLTSDLRPLSFALSIFHFAPCIFLPLTSDLRRI